jgi:O-antigen ligase
MIGFRSIKYVVAISVLAAVLWWADPYRLTAQLSKFPLDKLLLILLLLAANFVLVVFRYWRVLSHFGIYLPWNAAAQASVAGHAAGLVVWSMVGQVVGRQAILERFGVPVVLNTSIALYERVVIAAISGILCVAGAAYLFSDSVAQTVMTQVPVWEIAFAALVATSLSIWFGRSRFETALLKCLRTRKNFWRLAEMTSISLLGQALVLLSFVVAMFVLIPDIGVTKLFAAAAIISFAASLPITVNGWGIRELVSVLVLGKLEVPAADAVVVSLLVGVCSTLLVFLFIPVWLGKTSDNSGESRLLKAFSVPIDTERSVAFILGMTIAVATFFQTHFSLSGGVVNFNLADPLAIMVLATVMVRSVLLRQLPLWRVPMVNQALGLITVGIVVGFFHGWTQFGITQWALGSRLLGWLVLLGYLCSGALLVEYFGQRGWRRFCETLAITIFVVVVVQAWVRITGPWTPYDGYAGNRNAYAFQLLIVLSLLLAYSSAYAATLVRQTLLFRGFIWLALCAAVLVSLIWTGSRTGWIVGTVVLLVAYVCRLADKRLMVCALVVSAVTASIVWLPGWLLSDSLSGTWKPYINITGESSDLLRWSGYVHAVALWRESPLFGAGLGAIMVRSPDWFGFPLVVHNTSLWILAEFGLFGVCTFGAAFVILIRHLYQVRERMRDQDRALTLFLISFVTFSMLHEVFYQRIFWLVMGAALGGLATVRLSQGHRSVSA